MNPEQSSEALFRATLEPFWGLLHEDNITEIQTSPNGRIFQQTLREGTLDSGKNMEIRDIELFIRFCADKSNQIIGEKQESLDCVIFVDDERYRVSASVPPVSSTPQFSIRRFLLSVVKFDDLLNDGTLTNEHADHIKRLVTERHNLLISGTTGAGKTTLLNVIIQLASPITQRFVVLEEDAMEIVTGNENTLYQRNSEATSIEELGKKALRASPDRFIIGEIRSPLLAKVFFQAMTSGHTGSMATIHGADAKGVFNRFCEFLQTTGINPLAVAENLNSIIHIEKDGSVTSGRRVSEILSIKVSDGKPELISL